MINIKEYLEQINERERRMLLVAAVFLCCYIFYALIYSPLVSSVKDKQKLLTEGKETLQWMKMVRSQYIDVTPTESLSGEEALSELSNELKHSSFQKFHYQLEQTNDGNIQLSFDEVPYNSFVIWLWDFCGKHAITVKQFSVDDKSPAGVVSVMVLLSSGS
ncbi:MAG: type II secretion system protein GspM [Legionellaceae bacterium]|nr:type II secretion system protein GspM [Legionellaceae bacterium]